MVAKNSQSKIKRNPNGTITGLPMGDCALSKVVGVRFTQEVFEKLDKIKDKQSFIREAVEEKLNREN